MDGWNEVALGVANVLLDSPRAQELYTIADNANADNSAYTIADNSTDATTNAGACAGARTSAFNSTDPSTDAITSASTIRQRRR